MARGFARWDLPPWPRYSLRFVVGYACACEEEGNCERFCEGLCEGGLGFYGVIHSPKAIKTALDANL